MPIVADGEIGEQTLAPAPSAPQVNGHGTAENGSENGPPKPLTLDDAEHFISEGRSFLRANEFDEAADCFSKALEIRVGHYGELAPECASTFYDYGCALLGKAQSERDFMCEPKEKPLKVASETANLASETVNVSSEATNSEADGTEDMDEDNNDDEGDDAEEDIQEEDEESDLEQAWKMMDIARVIYEKQHKHTVEEVDVITGLADISLEKEDFQTCLEDYTKALAILKGLVEADDRQLSELYFKIALAQQLAKKPTEAIENCQRAIAVCEARLQRLKSEVQNPSVLASSSEGAETDANGSAKISKEDEIKEIELLLVDLSEKVDELKNMASAPSIMEALQSSCPEAAENVKQVFMAVANMVEKEGKAGSSSQDSDFPAPSNANVTHLGVVGRGIKRTAPIPLNGSPSETRKAKRSLDQLMTGDGSGQTQVGFNGEVQVTKTTIETTVLETKIETKMVGDGETLRQVDESVEVETKETKTVLSSA